MNSLGNCDWWKCRKSLGVTVYRTSKLATKQFCSKDCADRHALCLEVQMKYTHEPALFQNRTYPLKIPLA